MNRSSTGFGYLLFFLNLFICNNSYPMTIEQYSHPAMTSEICAHHTIYGHEIWADLLGMINFKKCSFFSENSVKKNDHNEKSLLPTEKVKKDLFAIKRSVLKCSSSIMPKIQILTSKIKRKKEIFFTNLPGYHFLFIIKATVE